MLQGKGVLARNRERDGKRDGEKVRNLERDKDIERERARRCTGAHQDTQT